MAFERTGGGIRGQVSKLRYQALLLSSLRTFSSDSTVAPGIRDMSPSFESRRKQSSLLAPLPLKKQKARLGRTNVFTSGSGGIRTRV